VIADGWKLQVSERPPATWLFDLANDPTEGANRAKTEPACGAVALGARRTRSRDGGARVAFTDRGADYVDHPLGAPDRPGDEFVYWRN